MLHLIAIWLAAAAFLGAGALNVVGASVRRDSFARWGCPAWWCRATGGLGVTTAAFFAFTAFSITRHAGLALGAAIIAAAVANVARHREWSHLPPLGVLVVLLALALA